MAGRDQVRDGGFGDQEGSGQIDFEDRFPLVRIDILDGRCRAGDARVVDQDVDAAELRHRVRHHGFDLLPVPDIAQTGLQARQFMRRRFECGPVDVARIDTVAGREKCRSDLLANAGSACSN